MTRSLLVLALVACGARSPSRLQLPPPGAEASASVVLAGSADDGGDAMLVIRRPLELHAGSQHLELPELADDARHVTASMTGGSARVVALELRPMGETSRLEVRADAPVRAWLEVSARVPVPELSLIYELRDGPEGSVIVPVIHCANGSGRAWQDVDLVWLDADGSVRAQARGVSVKADAVSRHDAGSPRPVTVVPTVDVDVSRELRHLAEGVVNRNPSDVIWERAGQGRRVLLVSGAGDLGGAPVVRGGPGQGDDWLHEVVTPDPGGAVVTLGPESGLLIRHTRLAYRVRVRGFDERYLVRLENTTAEPMHVRLVEPLFRGAGGRVSAATPTPAWTAPDRAAWKVEVPPHRTVEIRYEAAYENP